MQPYAGAAPLPNQVFRPNNEAEFELDQDVLMIRYDRSDKPTDRVELRELQEVEVIRTISVPGMKVSAMLSLSFGVVSFGIGLWGVLDSGAPSIAAAFLPIALAPLGHFATFFRGMFLLIGWQGRRRTEKFPKRREAEARRFIEAVAARRALVAPPPSPPEPPKPS